MTRRRPRAHGPDDRSERITATHRALDQARFGSDRILNLRATLPSAAEAERRAEAWLRERQAAHAGDVLVITGRGNRSVGGRSVVREAIVRLLALLERRGVVSTVVEHTPGSFVVGLAPMRALHSPPRRARSEPGAPSADPTALAALAGLAPETRALLRTLARCALTDLGVPDRAPFIEVEMLAQLARLAGAVPSGPDREVALRRAIGEAIEGYADS